MNPIRRPPDYQHPESPFGSLALAGVLTGRNPFWLRLQIITRRARWIWRDGKPLVHLGDMVGLSEALPARRAAAPGMIAPRSAQRRRTPA
jgi:hypothetical protein